MRHKHLIKTLTAAILAVLTCALPACASGPAPTQPTDKLVVYWSPVNDWKNGHPLARFMADNPDIEVVLPDDAMATAGGQADVVDGVEQYIETLNNQLMVGEGPDLIIWQDYGVFCDSFTDPAKTLQSNIFYDLDQFIADDDDFDLNDFAIANAGVVNGQRLYFPLSYNVPVLTASRQRLTQAGWNPDSMGTFAGFAQEAQAYAEGESLMALCYRPLDVFYSHHAQPARDAFLMALPGEDGEVMADVVLRASIPKSSKNKYNAYQLLKYLLYHEPVAQDYFYEGTTTNKAVIRSLLSSETLWQRQMQFEGVQEPPPLTQAIWEPFYQMITDVQYRGNAVPYQLYECMLPYMDGHADYQSCLDEFERKYKLYLYE